MNKEREAMEAEEYIVPSDQWSRAPEWLVAMATADLNEGIPTALANVPGKGWCMLQTGQGSYIAAQEWK